MESPAPRFEFARSRQVDSPKEGAIPVRSVCITVSHVLLRDAEESGDDEEPDLPIWQKQEWEMAKLVVSTDRFHELPTKFEIHERAIMQDFAHSVESDRQAVAA
jgi:hypothetical protein